MPTSDAAFVLPACFVFAVVGGNDHRGGNDPNGGNHEPQPHR